MDVLVLQKRLHSAQWGRTIFVVLFAFMVAVNGLLAFKLFNTSNQVVLIPTSITDGMVARGAVDVRYLEAVALDAAYGLYNTSPNNLNYGRNVIERVSSVAHRGRLLELYDEVAKDIKKRDISTVFEPHTIEHNFDDKTLVIKGQLETYLNSKLVSTEPRWIFMSFVIEAGSVRLAKISKLEVTQ
ncbi:hypothetical protein MXMO3_03503 (plasmid) [Maritalea myrionectae]|jgi:conjugal transfer pilus assembly protein TraE|uniref:Type IV conjugative transfer system protein TraE n=1 Tax=Maritalea myrionectae TaxID=454601 RepID=A0A2R4MJA4_9HYPH|nr:TraE/TraK family type IV conjugative transfer system protein [Maritalea myrionectae]AVX06006.1 hypothetical protein MXMO3_03503 [Maritalea myrionectae]